MILVSESINQTLIKLFQNFTPQEQQDILKTGLKSGQISAQQAAALVKSCKN